MPTSSRAQTTSSHSHCSRPATATPIDGGIAAVGQEGREAQHRADQRQVEQDGRGRDMGETVDAVQHAAIERGERDEEQIGKGDAAELDGHGEGRRIVAHAGRQQAHDQRHGDDQDRRERHQHQQQGGMGLAGEGDRLGAAMVLQLAREQRHEGRREGAFGEQAAEEVRQLESDEEGVGHRARAQHRRQHDVADEARDAAQQREAADGGDGAAEAHAPLFLPRHTGRAGRGQATRSDAGRFQIGMISYGVRSLCCFPPPVSSPV